MWKTILVFLGMWLSLMPQVVLAEGAGGSYRGIATIYYMIIAAVLSYGVYDIFGKNVGKFAAPLIFIIMYVLVPNV